jgi:trans-aconitate methyltransferase
VLIVSTSDWDAGSYHQVSQPQFEWGRRVLERLPLRGDERVLDIGCGTGRLTREVARRVPQGRVIALDRSASMLARAAEHLANERVALVRANAAALPFAGAFDVIFSTATFHWVLDHDLLFRSIFTALGRDGRLHAQCGGGPNLARLRTRAAALLREEPFRSHVKPGWREPWHYADVETTEARLKSAGFEEIDVTLEAAPVRFDSAEQFRRFAETVCLHPYLNYMPEDLRPGFSDRLVDLAAADHPPFVLDYWRLNLSAVRE